MNNNIIVLLLFVLIFIIKFINSYPIINVNKDVYINNGGYGNGTTISVYLIWYDESYQLILQSDYIEDSDIIMIGEYIDEMDITGWGKLNITVSNPMTVVIQDNDQAYMAGFIESVLTGQRIYQMYTNFAANEFKNNDNSPSPKLVDFLTQQMEFVRTQAFENNGSSQFWYSGGLIMSQFDGLVNGYQNSPSFDPLTEIQLYLLTSAGDLETLVDLFPSSNSKNKKQKQTQEIRKPTFKDQLMDCSGLIRLLPDYSDLYFAHTTWRYYYALLRIYKFYNLQFQDMSYRVHFSSSPGFLSSKDDFYITGNKLAIMETTNNIFNTTLYQYTIPQSVLVWQRAMISNMIATNSSEWVNLFSKYNSGTYQNQWMVLDYKMFTPGKALPSGTFYILEQIPGYVESADLTNHINENFYWPSYNIPYFENIYNISGYSSLPEVAPIYSNSYEKCPRAQIFKRNATLVYNFQDMKSLLQFNDFKNDPLSFQSPLNSISSRGDLLTIQFGNRTAVPFGGVDTKATSYNQIQSLSCSAISGPSINGGTLSPFQWSDFPSLSNISHIGVPKIFNFDWQEMEPN